MLRPSILAALVFLLAAGCGQKGALYLRDNPPSNVKTPKPETYKPLPYPKDTGEDEDAGAAKK